MIIERKTGITTAIINAKRPKKEIKAAIMDYAVKIRDKNLEHAFVFDRNYEHIFSLKGSRWKIQFSHREIMRLFGTIFMHNHPCGGSFSINDIYIYSLCMFDEVHDRCNLRPYLYPYAAGG